MKRSGVVARPGQEGFDQGEDVSSLMKKQGYIDVNIVKDYSGLDRVVYGTKSVLM